MDLDADGNLDLISGSWPGEIFLFRGGPGRTFAAPEMIKDCDGEIINIGGGIEESDDGSIMITGHGKFEEGEDGEYIVKYHGRELKSTAEKPISITGTASAVHAADWDDDGDLDLVVGDIGGNLYLIPNQGTAAEYAFAAHQALQAGGQPMRVNGDAGPFAVDWDGDGDLDLLVGDGDGSVSLFTNSGNSRQSVFEEAQQLISPGEVTYGADAPKEPQRGTRSKVCAADWNGDGRLDLLVGDYATQKTDLPEPTEQQSQEHAKIRKELESLSKEFSQLFPKLIGPERLKDPEQVKQLQEKLRRVSTRRSELQARLPREYDAHGWVWLFLQQ